MTNNKIAIFMVCVNGSGKSSYRDLLTLPNDIVIIDPDKIQKDNNITNIEAGKKAIKLFNDCIENGKSILIENTLTSNVAFKQINMVIKLKPIILE